MSIGIDDLVLNYFKKGLRYINLIKYDLYIKMNYIYIYLYKGQFLIRKIIIENRSLVHPIFEYNHIESLFNIILKYQDSSITYRDFIIVRGIEFIFKEDQVYFIEELFNYNTFLISSKAKYIV